MYSLQIIKLSEIVFQFENCRTFAMIWIRHICLRTIGCSGTQWNKKTGGVKLGWIDKERNSS